MKIGFLVLRDSFLKTMGRLIQASLDRGNSVLLFFDETEMRGSKKHQYVTAKKLEMLQEIGANLVSIDLDDIGNLRKRFGTDVLVTHEGFHFLKEKLNLITQLREYGTKVVSLGHFFEAANHPPNALDYFDKTYYLSQFSLDLHFAVWSNVEQENDLKKYYADQIEVTGSPMLDQLSGLNAEKIRTEYGIPIGMKVVVLFAPVISKATPWRFYVWGEKNKLKRVWRIVKTGLWKYFFESLTAQSFEEVAYAIRKFCDKNRSFLVVKSRQKQQDPDYLSEIADLYLSGENESYFPSFTSYKILAVADLSIAVMSMAVIESVAARVPVINIGVPHLDLHGLSNNSKQATYLEAVLNIEKTGPFNFPGCVTSVDRKKIVNWLRKKHIGKLVANPIAVARYQKMFLGMETERSSSNRILDSLEKLVENEMAKQIFPIKNG